MHWGWIASHVRGWSWLQVSKSELAHSCHWYARPCVIANKVITRSRESCMKEKTDYWVLNICKTNKTTVMQSLRVSCLMSYASIGSAPFSVSRSLARLAALSFVVSLGASVGAFGMGAITPSSAVLGILCLFASAARASSSSSTSSSSWLVILVPSMSLISCQAVSPYARLMRKKRLAFWYACASSFSPKMSSTRSRPPISLWISFRTFVPCCKPKTTSF